MITVVTDPVFLHFVYQNFFVLASQVTFTHPERHGGEENSKVPA